MSLFSSPISEWIQRVRAEADCFWLILPPFSGWLQKFHNTDIVYLTKLLPNVGVLLAWFWQMHKFQIHKLVSRHDHFNISTMYSVIIQAGVFREYWNKCFWRTKCFGSGTSSVYGIADIRQEGRSSDYAVSEIKRGNAIFSFGFARITEVRHMLVLYKRFFKYVVIFDVVIMLGK